MSVITREEQKTYERIKKKLPMVNASTQTMIDIGEPITHRKRPTIVFVEAGDDDSDEDDEYDPDASESLGEEDTDSEYETEDDDECCDKSNKKRKRGEKQPKLSKEVKQRLDKDQKASYTREDVAFYAALDEARQKAVDDAEEVIYNMSNAAVPLRFKILESEMDTKVKSLAITKVNHIAWMDASSSEYHKQQTWVENLCKLPIGKYKNLPVSATSGVDAIAGFLDTTRTKLDEVVYGHRDAKDQIIRLMAKWISNPQSKGLVIGIEGVHGIGKTSLVKDGICQMLGLPFGFVPLGGISDGSYFVGHSFTYEGSRWGKIADVLMNVGCMNPVLYFDELDKISSTHHGEEIANMLIHITDSTQNTCFQDKYFTELDLDLSRCLIVFSYNDASLVNPILKDRMVTIKASGYTQKDKVEIAKGYMLPRIFGEFGFGAHDLVFDTDVLNYIISVTEEEQGVRNLKRSLEEIVGQINLHRLLKKPVMVGPKKEKEVHIVLPMTVSREIVDVFVSKPKGVAMKDSISMMYI